VNEREAVMSRKQLVEMLRRDIAHAVAGTVEQAPEILSVPVEKYFDPDRFELEREKIFKRLPLMLALSSAIAEPGSYKAMEAAGVPVLLTRRADGELGAFVNMCSHRGAVIVPEGNGQARRFVCPYHAWTYDQQGALVGVLSKQDFGDFDHSCHGLTPLPVLERSGLVWVTLTPGSTLEIETFLCGYDKLLAHFGFESWKLMSRRTVEGPNWKIAYDGYLDLYHLPILHKDTFGPNMPNQAHYYAWGPHQRVSSPHPMLAGLKDSDEAGWPDALLMNGVWTVFPHVSIASFDAAGRGVLISQLFPGREVGSSFTVQSYVMETDPGEDAHAEVEKQVDWLEYVVREEDYATGLRQQNALKTRAKSHVMFGRNEAGGQAFHGWLDRLLTLEDDELEAAFAGSESPV
jgi:phenylpropionate dioxygenase-like ring-hydroxylating dioxygenase large terminal subunit